LSGLSKLLIAGLQPEAKSGQGFELAWAFKLSEAVSWVANISSIATIATLSCSVLLSKILCVHLAKAVL